MQTPRRFKKSSRIQILLLSAAMATATGARPPNDPIERTFSEPRADVERAVAAAKSNCSGKLPALEGFVGPIQRPLERYEKIYYQCVFQVIPALSGETSVRVSAKITAWYDDPDRQKSGYEVLPSNGRLENDALDRVEQILQPESRQPENQSPTVPDLSLRSVTPGMSATGIAGLARRVTPASPGVGFPGSASEEEIQQLRARRVAAEKRVQQLNNALQNLQQVYDNQTRPSNIVAVKKNATPVYAHPEETGKSLFAAAARDQFELVEIRGDWIHVNISGESRGWIRKSQVDFSENPATGNSAGPQAAPLFRVTREETRTFPGSWPPLNGKTVRIYSVQPASRSAQTRASEKREFTRELFLRALAEQPSTENPVAGAVVVFDSADGGQASVTLASLRQWQEGKVSESAFWNACSLDPPETFRPAPKKP